MITGLPPFYSRDRERLFNNILNGEVAFPSYISTDVKNLLTQLFVKDPNRRLGAINDAEEIKSHPWFRQIDWNKLLRKQVHPPFIPDLAGPLDLHNFDEEFTRMPVVDSAGREAHLASLQESPTYRGFTYQDSTAMDIEEV